MSEHSVLPWRFEPLTGDDDRGMGYIVDANGSVVDHHGDSAKWKQENLANADLKIKAVNSRDQLLRTLRAAGHALRSFQYGNVSEELAKEIADSIDATLAVAEAKP